MSGAADQGRFLHDLRAPLARARAYAKLLREDCAGEQAELADQVLQALEDLEKLVRAAEDHTGGAS